MKQHVGVAWYRPRDWEKLRQAAADPEQLEQTHSAWLRIATKACRELKAAGVEHERVIVDVDDLIAWCREQRMPVDAKARSQFVAYFLHKRHTDRD